MTGSAITASGLRKSFGDHVVLDGVDLGVAVGTVYALLGPNGAGKTTIVQILSTLIGADHGRVRVAGHDLAEDPDAVRHAVSRGGRSARRPDRRPRPRPADRRGHRGRAQAARPGRAHPAAVRRSEPARRGRQRWVTRSAAKRPWR
jgi:ABC-type cobalamin/Fe3+-siderophores transport system ATPase subunit